MKRVLLIALIVMTWPVHTSAQYKDVTDSALIRAWSFLTSDTIKVGVAPPSLAVANITTAKPGYLFQQPDIIIGSAAAGMIRLGAGYIGFGTRDTLYNNGELDLGGTMCFRQADAPDGNFEFVWFENSGALRFAIPKSGPGLATWNARSMIIAGPSVLEDSVVIAPYWGFDWADYATDVTGADLGVQDDLEVLGSAYIKERVLADTIDNITAAPIQILADVNITGNLSTATFDSGTVLLNDVGHPDDDVDFAMSNKYLHYTFGGNITGHAVEINITGNSSADALHIHQHDGNPSGGTMLHIECDDPDLIPAVFLTNQDTIVKYCTTDSTVKAYMDSTGHLHGSADSAGKSLGDASGNTITTTYAPLASPTFTGIVTQPDWLWTTGGTDANYDPTDVPADGDQLTWNTDGTTDWQAAGGGAGEANTISSVGESASGADTLTAGKSGVDLRIKSIIAGINLSATVTDTTITLDASGSTDSSLVAQYAHVSDTANVLRGEMEDSAHVNDTANVLRAEMEDSAHVNDTANVLRAEMVDSVMSVHRDSIIHTYKFVIPDPNSYYDIDSLFPFEPVTAKAITITRIDITCDADPVTEPAMSLRFANNFISRTTPTTIDVVTTTNGVTTITSGFDDATVPAGNCMYLAMTADPIAAIKSITFKVSYTVD